MLYALSTCQWCHKTKTLLEELGIAFDYDYVDLLEGKEQDSVMDSDRAVESQRIVSDACDR